MKWKMVASLMILLTIFLLGAIDSEMLHAGERAEQYKEYSYSVIASLTRWIVSTQSDFECSGNASHVNTSAYPGDVILEKCTPWGAWWNASWKYRMKINVSEMSGSTLHEYQIRIILNPWNFNYTRAEPDGGDIRFIAHGTMLPYWIEKWNPSGESIIWVKMNISASDTETIYMYYGNPLATSRSNGTAVFLFFEDFESNGGWYEDGLWHTTGGNYHSSSHSKWYGQEATNDYDTGATNSGNLISPSFNLTGNAILDLYFWREVENLGWSGYDVTSIYESSDNATWNEIWHNDSSNPSMARWISLSIPLAPSSRYLRFYFDTVDALYNNYRGWFLDDIRIRKYVSPEPSVEMGAEQSLSEWIDYFGGNADETLQNATIENGNATLSKFHQIVIPFQDGFEGNLSNWDDNYPTFWYITTAQQHNGSASVMADGINDGALVSDDIDLSMASSAHLDFWFRKHATEPNDIRLYFYDGSSYNLISRLDLLGGDDTWLHYGTDIDLSIYGVSNFRIVFYAVLGGGEMVWVDDVVITANMWGYFTHGEIISSVIMPGNISSWNVFYASSQIPSGTSVVFKIINASSNAVICSINATEAENGYNLSILSGVEGIRIKAEMNSSSPALTPVIYSWGVSWNVGYYSTGYLVSCPHDTSSLPDYHTIEWNATLPPSTSIKFQISTSSDGIHWSDFVGPDGNNTTFYNVSGSQIWSGHDGERYIRFIAYFQTQDTSVTPVLHDVTISYYGG